MILSMPRFALRAVGASALLALLLSSSLVSAAGDPEAGQEKSATCAACHGVEGVSNGPQWPILAGQYASYLEHALQGYRSGVRENAIMQGFAAQLTDDDIEDLAAWFSSQTGPLRTAPRGY